MNTYVGILSKPGEKAVNVLNFGMLCLLLLKPENQRLATALTVSLLLDLQK